MTIIICFSHLVSSLVHSTFDALIASSPILAWIDSVFICFDFRFIDIKTNYVDVFGKSDSNRHSHVPETHKSNFCFPFS